MVATQATASELIAHRGFACDVPENTVASVERAWAAGADAVEVDVRIAEGGVAVLAHDTDQERTATTLNELLIEQWPPGNFIFDIKERQSNRVAAIVEQVNASSLTQESVVFQSDHLPSLNLIRNRWPSARLYYVHALKRHFPLFRKPNARAILESLSMLDAQRISLKGRSFVDADFISVFSAAGLAVNIWTVDDPERAAHYFQLGADGLITDEVRLLSGNGAACLRR